MKENSSKTKSRIIRLVTVLCILVLFALVILPIILAYTIYDSSFNVRFDTYAPTAFKLEDFDGLEREKYSFSSADDQKLVGYKYCVENQQPQGLVVFAHGFGGGGHVGYLDCINYFAHNGFWVFAYDATGNDESDGLVGGLQQALVDLDYALKFVKRHSDFKNLPLLLFGHSWGGYAVSAVLNLHKDVKAVCEIAGFNNSMEFLHDESKKGLGGYTSIVMPYVNAHVNRKFGEYTTYTALDGFASSKAEVIVIHAKDDEVVPFQNAQIIEQTYKNDNRFHFFLFDKGGHSNLLYSAEGLAYVDELNAALVKYANEKAESFNAELKEKWINKNLDRARWANRLNYDLFQQITEIFTQALGK